MFLSEKELTVEVSFLDVIEIKDSEFFETSFREGFEELTADTTNSYDEKVGFADSLEGALTVEEIDYFGHLFIIVIGEKDLRVDDNTNNL